MGNKNSKKQKEDLAVIIKKAEDKLLIAWTTNITKQWFEYHLNSAKNQLLQHYIDKLCILYGFDGYGLSLMNKSFFMKISSNIIDEKAKNMGGSQQMVTKTKQLIDTFYDEHIIRVQDEFNKKFPTIDTKKHDEPNLNYLEQIKDSPNKILQFYHYQTEHRLGYQSRSDQRVWILQPSVCRRYYGKIELIKLHKFTSVHELQQQNKDSNDPLSKSILFSPNNKSHKLSLESISCFIWYSLTLSSSKDSFHNFSMPKGAYSKRVNASSGGLHPTESYFILPAQTVKTDAANSSSWLFCHYAVSQHALEIVGSFEKENDDEKSDKYDNDENGNDNVFYVLLSAVSHREVWKYGERGLRYCLLDNGHAMSSVVTICNLMGWQAQISNIKFNALSNRFKLPKAEYPRILLRIKCFNSDKIKCKDFDIMNAEKWTLSKNEFITESYCELGDIWPILGHVQTHCFMKEIDDEKLNNEWIDCDISLDEYAKNAVCDYVHAANYALRHRRSALEFEIVSNPLHVLKSSCYIMKNLSFPFGHLCVYILYTLRIDDIESGIYLLFPKHAKKYEQIWQKLSKSKKNATLIDGKSDDDKLVIYQYETMEIEKLAKMSKEMACHQNLCFNASFTIDFCVDLEVAVENGFNYDAAHWECGYVGQLLYIHMESLGLGATAIGCYLDDFASANAGFLPTPKKAEKGKDVDPEELKRFDNCDHPFKNIRSLCHFSCGTPGQDLRYPYFAWDSELFPLD